MIIKFRKLIVQSCESTLLGIISMSATSPNLKCLLKLQSFITKTFISEYFAMYKICLTLGLGDQGQGYGLTLIFDKNTYCQVL